MRDDSNKGEGKGRRHRFLRACIILLFALPLLSSCAVYPAGYYYGSPYYDYYPYYYPSSPYRYYREAPPAVTPRHEREREEHRRERHERHEHEHEHDDD
jgi:hypothetical protein